MSQQCDVCGKRPLVGNNVSHSKVHTKRRFMPNLHSTRLVKNGKWVRGLLCTRCIRTQTKAAH